MDTYSTYAWLIIAAVFIATEIATGTFYLLMLAIAAVVTWFAERMGASFLAQTIVFLLASIVLCFLVHQYRRKLHLTEPDNIANDLDAGELVNGTDWHNGVGSTHYRGAKWQVASINPQDVLLDGTYAIVKFEGSRLLVKSI